MQSIILMKSKNLKLYPIWGGWRYTEIHLVSFSNNIIIYIIDKINQSYSDHIPQYRACVISQLPQLKSFDFSGVTKNDRFVSANINVKKIRKSAAWKK